MNGRDWRKLDTGFRGDVYRFCVYADALQAQDLVQTCQLVLSVLGEGQREVLMAMTVSIADMASAKWSPYDPSSSHGPLQSLAFLLVLLLVVASATVWRHGNKIMRFLRSMVRNRNRHVRFAPVAEDSESNTND